MSASRPGIPQGRIRAPLYLWLGVDLEALYEGVRGENAAVEPPRLIRFLPWLVGLAIAFGACELWIWAAIGEPNLLLEGAYTLAFAGVLAAAWRLDRARTGEVASLIIALGLGMASLAGSTTVGGIEPSMALLPVLGFAIRLPYLQPRSVVRPGILVVGASVLVFVAGTAAQPPLMHEPIQSIFGDVILLAIIGLVMATLLDLSTSASTSQTSLRGALRTQEKMQADRAAVRRILAEVERISRDATPEEMGERIANALTTIPGVSLGAVLERDGVGLRILGLQTSTGFPLWVGDHLPLDRAAALLAGGELGSWAEAVSAIPLGQRRHLEQAGLVAMAYAPMRAGEDVVGLVEIGTDDVDAGSHLVDDLPAVREVAAAASAVLSRGLADRQNRTSAWNTVRQVIDDAAFSMVFQPIMGTGDRAVVGYEALTRFADATPPDRRFREAAAAGLGVELELAALRTAIRDAPGLPQADAWLSVNVSPACLDAPARLAAVLREARRPIVLELTEHTPVADYRRLRQKLREIGVPFRVAIDDAGAGYASMQHVIELRPALIKLDRSIIHGIDRDPVRQALVAGMHYFAERVGCRLLAEGVETETELATVASLDVPLVQGFLLGRPTRVADLSGPRARRPRPRVRAA